MSIDQNPSNQQHGVSPNDLPPLDQTAQVPPIHSDTLNNPAYWNDKFDSPAAEVPLEHRDDKHEKKSFPLWAKYTIGGIATSVALAGGAMAYQYKKTSDVLNDALDNPPATASAPAVPGEKVAEEDTSNVEKLAPVILTDAEVATLQDGDSEASHAILDAKLIPRIQEVIDRIRKNDGKLDGLDISDVAPSSRATSVLTSMANLINPIEICQTTPNLDGSLNFCEPSSHTKIELGEPIEFFYNDSTDEKDYRMKTDVRAEIAGGNQIILTAER